MDGRRANGVRITQTVHELTSNVYRSKQRQANGVSTHTNSFCVQKDLNGLLTRFDQYLHIIFLKNSESLQIIWV